jgi:hypothetical protein
MKRPWAHSKFWTLFLIFLAWVLASVLPSIAGEFWVSQKKQILASVEKSFGASLSYASLSSNILESLDFHNVRLMNAKRVVFQATEVRIFWNWGAILQAHWDDSIAKIQIVHATVDLDQTEDAQLIQRVQNLLNTSGTTSSPLPPIEVFNLSGTWHSSQGTFGLDQAFITLKKNEGEFEIDFRTALKAQLTPALSGINSASARLSGVLFVDTAFRDWVLKAHADAVENNLFDLGPFSFQFEKTPTVLRFSKTQDNQPLDLSVLLSQQHLLVRLNADQYRFSRWIHWKSSPIVASWLATRWTGKASLNWDTSSGDWSAQLEGRAAFDTPLLPQGSSFQGKIVGNPHKIEFSQAHFQTPDLEVRFDGDVLTKNWLPEGKLEIQKNDVNGIGRLGGSLDLKRQEDQCLFEGQNWALNRLGLSGIRGSLRGGPSAWVYNLKFGLSDFSEAQLALSGSFNAVNHDFSLTYQLAHIPLEALATKAAVKPVDPALAGVLAGWQASVRGALGQAAGNSVLYPASWQLFDTNDPGRQLNFSLSYQNKVLSVVDLSLKWNDQLFQGQVVLDFADSHRFKANSSWVLWGKTLEVNASYDVETQRLIWGGPSGIAGVLEKNFGGWQSSFQFQDFPLPDGAQLSFQGSSNGGAHGTWASVNWGRLTGFYPVSHQPYSVDWDAEVRPGQWIAHILSWKDAWENDQGSIEGSWGTLDQPWKIRVGIFSPQGEVLSSKVNILLGRAVAADFHWEHSPLARFFSQPWSGGGKGRATLSWSKNSGLLWNADLESQGSYYGTDPVSFSMNASGNGVKTEVNSFRAKWRSVQISDGRFLWDNQHNYWSWSSRQTIDLGEKKWSWTGMGEGHSLSEGAGFETRYAWSQALLGSRRLADGSLTLSSKNNLWDLSSSDKVIQIDGSSDDSVRVEIHSPGGLSVSAEGTWTSGVLDFEVTSFRIPLDQAGEWLNSDLFRMKSGALIGSFHLEGPWTDPNVTGDAMFKRLVFQNLYLNQLVGPIDAPIEFRNKTITMPAINIAPQGQVWTLDAQLHLDHGVPDQFLIHLVTGGLSLLPVHYPLTGVDVEGWVSGSVTIQGDNYAATILADLTLQNAQIHLITSPEVTGSYYGVNVNLHLKTGHKVEFVWPDPNLPLVDAIAAVDQKLNIEYNERTSQFSMVGKIDLRAGEINYVSQSFQIQEGRLTFQETQDSFDPYLDVMAQLRVRESDGPVIVQLRANGPLSQFFPRFSSIPYKTPEELQQIVGSTLALPSDNSSAPLLNSAVSVASDFGSGFLLRPFEESVKKNFGLDLFTIRTELLGKALAHSAVSSSTPGYLDNTSVFFGKYLGDDLFLQGDLNFHQDQIVGGVQTSGLNVDPEIQLAFNTPFFLLNWTLTPQHPQNLFVTDNSVTFSWNWSY